MFNKNVSVKLGPDVSPETFPDINLEYIPLYDFYKDGHKDSKGQP